MAVYKKNYKIILFGTGFIAEEVFHYFEKDSNYSVEAFTVDKKNLKKKKFMGLDVVPFDNVEKIYSPKKFGFFVAVGYTNLNSLRAQKFKEARSKGYKLVSYISSKSSIFHKNHIKENTLILENSTIQPTAKLGNNVFIWANNLIGHHVTLNDNCYVSGNCTVSGSSIIGKNCFLGANCTIGHNVVVENDCLIGSNALVTNNMKKNSVAVSQPTKIIKFGNRNLISKLIK